MHIDLIVESSRAFTGTNNAVYPTALAISGDRIVAVGSSDHIHALAREWNSSTGADKTTFKSPEVRDFGDAFIMPGFHDAHLHFFHSAIYRSTLATMFVGTNEADCIAKLRAFAAKRPQGWLLAQGWREYCWDPPVLPSKHSLDEAFPHRPVALYSGDEHSLWLNSVALDQLGISPESTPPTGGFYDHDEHGELTGIVRETAAMELMGRIMETFSDDEIATAYRSFFTELARFGITSVCDMSLMSHPGLDFVRDDIHARLLASDDLTARVHLFPTLLSNFDRFEEMRAQNTHPLLRVCGLKQFFDGVSSQHTAWLDKPYENARFNGDCGQPTMDPSVMRTLVLEATRRGYPVRIHTIGDAAIHAALDIFEEARHLYGSLPQSQFHCLEHLENFQPADISRLVNLQVVASVQPTHMTLDPGGPTRDLGLERSRYMWPLETLLDQGTTLAFGTDSPVTDINPFNVLYSAITRQDPITHEPEGGWYPIERITMLDALRAYTHGSAISAGRAPELGTLRPGKLADFTVLDRDLFLAQPDEIQKSQVLATFVGGRCVFER